MIVTTMLISLAIAADRPAYDIAVAGDGDSLHIGEVRYRLFGIDAPEFDQICSRGGETWACGKAASEHLAKLITGREIRCDPKGTDTFGRVLAKCSTEGLDVNRAMVAAGLAVAFRRYSTDYVSAEETARNNRRGLWAGSFEMPSEVRAAPRPPASTPRRQASVAPKARRVATPQIASCVIKGNHSRRGEWIYHVPGMPYYRQTRPEAVFCSEAAARAAGYRRAKVR